MRLLILSLLCHAAQASPSRYRDTEIFDLDILGKFMKHEACGKGCGSCGAAHQGCDYEGQTLQCSYSFCKPCEHMGVGVNCIQSARIGEKHYLKARKRK